VTRRLEQRQALTCFLRVPAEDWPRVKIGEKTEFRTRHRERVALVSIKPPTAVVAYADEGEGHDWQVMVLEEYRYEPLFSITFDAEAVEREGFASYDDFRRYWRKREGGVYMPAEKVWVWRLRPMETGDTAMLGISLLHHLYGRFLDGPDRGRLDFRPTQLLA
jgi:hypothetical protein